MNHNEPGVDRDGHYSRSTPGPSRSTPGSLRFIPVNTRFITVHPGQHQVHYGSSRSTPGSSRSTTGSSRFLPVHTGSSRSTSGLCRSTPGLKVNNKCCYKRRIIFGVHHLCSSLSPWMHWSIGGECTSSCWTGSYSCIIIRTSTTWQWYKSCSSREESRDWEGDELCGCVPGCWED